MNKTHTHYLQSCKLFFALLVALFCINGITYASHADLELTMTSPNASPGIYANVDIEITITNNGPEATNNVLLEFPFPTDLPITGDPVESQGFFSNWWTGTGTWDVGTLASGQSETVTLTLFTLAEDLFFYGQVVNSSIVDNDSSPNNGTPPTLSEDDEAVVNINDTGGGICELIPLVGNIICDDGGTADPLDDNFSFLITVNEQNAPSNNWATELPLGGGATITHPYGAPYSIALTESVVQNLPSRIYNFTVYDPANPSCSEDVSVLIPQPCSSNNPCITATALNIQCFASGTPADDTWSFDLNVSGTNTGGQWIATAAGQSFVGNYNETETLGLFAIIGGGISISVRDSQNTSCVTTVYVEAPQPCSNTSNCSITATVVSIDCNTQGNTNPNDDTWSYIVDIDGTNTSNSWVVELANSPNSVTYSAPYSSNFTLEDLPLNGPEVNTQTIMDAANPSCQTTISVDAPFPCNNASKPDLELSMTSNDQPGAFQNISYEVTVTNTGTAPANGVNIFGTTPDNVVLQGGNECNATAGNTSCQLSSIGWFFTTIAPGQSETLTVNFFTLDANPITFYMQVGDLNGEDEDSTPGNGTPPTVNEDDEAAFTIGGGQPCQISGPFYNNIQCFDNGTPIEADDFFDFEISVDGTAGGAFNLTTNAGVNGVFNYGQTITISGFPYANLPFSMSATDVNDPICFLSQNNNGSFQPCSTGTDCTIFQETTRVCDDNGTTDSNDDTYVIEMTATGTGADAGTGWTVDYNGQTYSGLYGQVGIVGPFLINDSNFTLTLQDNENPDCSTNFLSLPPPPCSTGGGGDTDLKLEVTPNTIFAGSGIVVYTATITNEGLNDASGVSMLFDNGSSFGIGGFDASTGSYSYSTDIWSVGTIAAGTSETIILDDQYVDFSAQSLPTYPFFEILTMDGTDPDSTPGNDNGDRTADEDDEVTFPIFPNGQGGYPSDLSLNLSTSVGTVNLGETFSIFCNINLEGGAASTDVQASIVLPSTVQYQGFTAAVGDFNPNTGIWDVGYIGGLTNAQIEIVVNLVDDSQPSVIYSQITNADAFDFDSTPNNGTCCTPNEDDESVLTIQPGGNVLKPDLEFTNTDYTLAPNGQSLDLSFTILNSGTASATGHLTEIFISTDNQLSPNDELLISFNMSPLAQGEDITRTLTNGNFPILNTLPDGDYFLLFKIDDDNIVNELNENNNLSALPITFGSGGNGTDLELSISSSSTFQQWDYVSFDITLTNTGTVAATGAEVRLENIDGGVLQGGNEGDATAGTFYPVGGAPSHWDLGGVTIGAGQSETLTINCFVLDPTTIQIYVEVSAMNETDIDSSPNNGMPFAPDEDDEAAGFVGNAPTPMQLVASGVNNLQIADYQYFKIQNLYPNPVNADLKIVVASAVESDVVLQIANTQGSEVAHFKKQLTQGQNVLGMDVSTLPKGIYFLKIETEEGMEVRRFLKQ